MGHNLRMRSQRAGGRQRSNRCLSRAAASGSAQAPPFRLRRLAAAPARATCRASELKACATRHASPSLRSGRQRKRTRQSAVLLVRGDEATRHTRNVRSSLLHAHARVNTLAFKCTVSHFRDDLRRLCRATLCPCRPLASHMSPSRYYGHAARELLLRCRRARPPRRRQPLDRTAGPSWYAGAVVLPSAGHRAPVPLAWQLSRRQRDRGTADSASGCFFC